MGMTVSVTMYCSNYEGQRYRAMYVEEQPRQWKAIRSEEIPPLTEGQRKALYNKVHGIVEKPSFSKKLFGLMAGKKQEEAPEEDNGTQMSGNIYGDVKCPHCGNTGYVKCGVCKRLSCWDGGPKFHCAVCGNNGTVTGTIDSLGGSQC